MLHERLNSALALRLETKVGGSWVQSSVGETVVVVVPLLLAMGHELLEVCGTGEEDDGWAVVALLSARLASRPFFSDLVSKGSVHVCVLGSQ